MVGQEPVLFRGTIFDNIAIGFPEATREEVQSVAEMAYAHDFITQLPNVSILKLCNTLQYTCNSLLADLWYTISLLYCRLVSLILVG